MEIREKLKEILKKGSVKYLEKLLKDLPPRSILSRVNEELDSDGTTPLIHCVKSAGVGFADTGSSYIDCAIYLIKHGAKVGTKDSNGKTALFYAAGNKNDRMGQTLLAAGADPYVKNDSGVSVLGIAIQTGAIGTAKKIIELFDKVLNEVDGTGCPPLILALQLGNEDLCRHLINKGADVNIQEERSHRTALHYALYMKKHELFEQILGQGQNLELIDYKKTTIIHRASTIHDVKYLQSIFDSKMPPSTILLNLADCDGANSVMLACQNGNIEHLKLLVEHGASVSATDKSGRTALHHCVENLDTDCADYLLKRDTSLLNTPDNEGLTPLHMSAITGNEAMLHLLLKKGANLTCLDEEKHTVVHWATVSGQTEILDLLIEHGAELSTPDNHLAYPVHYAAQMAGRRSRPPVDGGQGTILKLLLEHNVDMTVEDKDGRQPLLWGASAGNVDACTTLVAAGAEVEAKDKDGLTALHCAASRGHTAVIEELVGKCHANMDAVDKNRCTPLFYAITLGNVECVKVLIQLGANTSHCDNKGRSPAHCAAIQGSQETLVLLQRKNVDLWLPSKQGDYPIHEAALGGHEGIVKFLLGLRNRLEVVKLCNRDGRNCLHIAALVNHLALCQLLLDSGADVNAVMRHKGKYYTPLDIAVIKSHKEIEQFLTYSGGRTGILVTNDAAIIIQRNFKLRKRSLRPKSPSKIRVQLATPSPENNSEKGGDTGDDNKNDSCRVESENESQESEPQVSHHSVKVVISLADPKQTAVKSESDVDTKTYDEPDHKSKAESSNGSPQIVSKPVTNKDSNKSSHILCDDCCVCLPTKTMRNNTVEKGGGGGGGHLDQNEVGTRPTKQRGEVKFENSTKEHKLDHRIIKNKEKIHEKQHHQHQQQHQQKQQQHQQKHKQQLQRHEQKPKASNNPSLMQNGNVDECGKDSSPDCKSHTTGSNVHAKRPVQKPGTSRRDIAQEVQASVRRFTRERQTVKDIQQLRRAKMYSGPEYDIELVRKLVDKYNTDDLHSSTYHSGGHSDKNYSDTNESTNEVCKDSDQNSDDVNTVNDHKMTKPNRQLERVVARTEDLFNTLNQRVSSTLERAKTTNTRLRETLATDRHDRAKTIPSQDKREKIQEQRNQKYNEWKKQKADELRERLLKAYKPYKPTYSRQQASISRGSTRCSKRSESPSRASGVPSRPATTQSYHSMPATLPRYSSSTYSHRQRAFSANPESYATIMTRYGLCRIRNDPEFKVSCSYKLRDSRARQGLVFLPPDVYEERIQQTKKKRDEVKQQSLDHELGQSTV